MKIRCSYTELVDAVRLQGHPKNPNVHPDNQIERLAKVIDYQGQRSPVVVSKLSGYVIVGHGRLAAMKKLGWEKVAVDYQDFENEAQEYAHMTADNALAEWADLDLSQINLEVMDFGPELDIDMLGIEDFVIEPVEKYDTPIGNEDEVPEVADPITKRGDVWLLGDHRVLCGDSTMIDNVEKLMAGEKADMVFTDPPYGMKLASNSGIINSRIKGDNEDFTDDLINTIFYFDYVKEMFIFGADYFAQLLPKRNSGSWVVWDKRSQGNDEIGALDGVFGSDFELCWSKNKHKRELARILKETGVFANKGEDKCLHPTQKPIKLVEWFFRKWCKDLNKCVDLYLGSGSTLIACEKTNRKCFGMELDEHYCDVIVNRWQNYTGKKAVLESNGKTYDELKEVNV